MKAQCYKRFSDPSDHDLDPYRLTRQGLLLKCNDCNLLFVIPRSSQHFPSQYREVFSRADYIRRFPAMAEPSYYRWVDPAEGEEVHTSIKDSIDPSPTWKIMGFPIKDEVWASAYFDAVLDNCRNKGLVIGMDVGLTVCVPVGRLLGMESTITAYKVHAIETFQEFLDAVKEKVDDVVQDPKSEDYWGHFSHELTDMIRSSGAHDKISLIAKRFGIG